MERHATHQLDVVVALSYDAPCGLTHHSKGLNQKVVEVLACIEPLAELTCLRTKDIVAEGAHLGFERADVRHDGLKGFQLLSFATAKEA